MGWVAGRVAPHKRIRHLEFIDQIPKSASGKILRRVLIDRDKVPGSKPKYASRLPSGAASQLDPSHRSSRVSPTGS